MQLGAARHPGVGARHPGTVPGMRDPAMLNSPPRDPRRWRSEAKTHGTLSSVSPDAPLNSRVRTVCPRGCLGGAGAATEPPGRGHRESTGTGRETGGRAGEDARPPVGRPPGTRVGWGGVCTTPPQPAPAARPVPWRGLAWDFLSGCETGGRGAVSPCRCRGRCLT